LRGTDFLEGPKEFGVAVSIVTETSGKLNSENEHRFIMRIIKVNSKLTSNSS